MAALDPETARIDIGTALSAVMRRMPRIVVATVLLLALTYGVLLFVPKLYESSATILVESRSNIFLRASDSGTTSGSGASPVSDDMAIESQVQLIQSRDTLLKVVEVANLAAEPELTAPSSGIIGLVMGLFGQTGTKRNVTDIILANMEDRLTVIRERDSRIISVLFRSESPALAAKVANAIAEAHVNRRAGLEISDTADATEWLSAEIDKLRQKVAEAEAKVANFRIEHDLFAGQDGQSNLIDQQLSDIATQITQSRERENTAASRANVLRSLIKAGKPINSVEGVENSATIQTLGQQKSELQGQKAEMLARLLPSHPSVVAITAQITEIDAQIVAEGKRIADALDASSEIEGRIQASLGDQMSRLKTTASGDLTAGVMLAELEREAKAERDLLETYLARYRDASARTDSKSALPDVRVVSAAAPTVEPASPKTTLILIAVAVVSLAGQIGFILFGELVSGRAIIEAAPAATVVERLAERRAGPRAAAAGAPPVEPDAEPDLFENPVAVAAERVIDAVPEVDAGPVAEPPAYEPVEPIAAEAVAKRPRMPVSAAMEATSPAWPALEPALPPKPDPRPIAGAPVPMRPAPHRAGPPRRLPPTLVPLVDAIAAGRERVILVMSLGDPGFSVEVLELIGAACSGRGLGMATIDAASGRVSPNAGLGDLLVGAASFGDVVHGDRDGQLARVPWGRQERLDHRSTHGVTLAEALSDIYNVVLIAAGEQGLSCSLPVFAGINGYVVVASGQPIDGDSYQGLEADAAALGFDRVQIVGVDDDAFQVA